MDENKSIKIYYKNYPIGHLDYERKITVVNTKIKGKTSELILNGEKEKGNENKRYTEKRVVDTLENIISTGIKINPRLPSLANLEDSYYLNLNEEKTALVGIRKTGEKNVKLTHPIVVEEDLPKTEISPDYEKLYLITADVHNKGNNKPYGEATFLVNNLDFISNPEQLDKKIKEKLWYEEKAIKAYSNIHSDDGNHELIGLFNTVGVLSSSVLKEINPNFDANIDKGIKEIIASYFSNLSAGMNIRRIGIFSKTKKFDFTFRIPSDLEEKKDNIKYLFGNDYSVKVTNNFVPSIETLEKYGFNFVPDKLENEKVRKNVAKGVGSLALIVALGITQCDTIKEKAAKLFAKEPEQIIEVVPPAPYEALGFTKLENQIKMKGIKYDIWKYNVTGQEKDDIVDLFNLYDKEQNADLYPEITEKNITRKDGKIIKVLKPGENYLIVAQPKKVKQSTKLGIEERVEGNKTYKITTKNLPFREGEDPLTAAYKGWIKASLKNYKTKGVTIEGEVEMRYLVDKTRRLSNIAIESYTGNAHILGKDLTRRMQRDATLNTREGIYKAKYDFGRKKQ
jgi:hypothetical protein